MPQEESLACHHSMNEASFPLSVASRLAMGQSPGLLLTEAALGPQANRVRPCRETPGGLSVTEQVCCLLSAADAQSPVPRFLKDPDRLQSLGTRSTLVAALPGEMVPLAPRRPSFPGAPRSQAPLRQCSALPRVPVILPALFLEPVSALSLTHSVTAGAMPRDKPWAARESVGEAPA